MQSSFSSENLGELPKHKNIRFSSFLIVNCLNRVWSEFLLNLNGLYVCIALEVLDGHYNNVLLRYAGSVYASHFAIHLEKDSILFDIASF